MTNMWVKKDNLILEWNYYEIETKFVEKDT